MHRPCSRKQNDPHQQKKQFKVSKIEDKAKIFNKKKGYSSYQWLCFININQSELKLFLTQGLNE